MTSGSSSRTAPRGANTTSFAAWCGESGAEALPATPETVAAYVTALADARVAPSTIARQLTAIGRAHQLAGLDSPTRTPTVRAAAADARRSLEGASVRICRPSLATCARCLAKSLTECFACAIEP